MKVIIIIGVLLVGFSGLIWAYTQPYLCKKCYEPMKKIKRSTHKCESCGYVENTGFQF